MAHHQHHHTFLLPAVPSHRHQAYLPPVQDAMSSPSLSPPTGVVPPHHNGGTAMMASSSYAPPEGKVGACSQCRARKVKCPGPTNPGAQCPQCAKHGLDCVFEAHRRGRKLGSKTKRKREEHPSGSGSSDEESDAGNHAQNGSGKGKNKSRKTSATQSATQPEEGTPEPAEEVFDRELPHPLGLLATVSSAIHAKLHNSVDPYHSFATPPTASGLVAALQGYAFHEILDVDPERDLIDSKVITLAECERLFAFFYDKLLEPSMGILDPHLHTVPFVRTRSSALLCFVCYLAARHDPSSADLVEPLRRKLHSLIKGPFLYNGRKSVELVVATLLVHYFRRQSSLVATDHSWQALGFAIRMATDIGLNHAIDLPANASERDRRLARFRERAWLLCWLADRGASAQTGRKWTAVEDELVMNSARWAESDIALPFDSSIHAFVHLQRIHAGMTATMPTSKLSRPDMLPTSYQLIISNMWSTELKRWEIEWVNERSKTSLHLGTLAPLALAYPRLLLLTRNMARTEGPERLRHAYECFAHAYGALDTLMKSDREIFTYCNNTIFVIITYIAVIALRFRHCSLSLRTIYPFLISVGDFLIKTGETPSHKEGASVEYGKLIKQMVELARAKDDGRLSSNNPAVIESTIERIRREGSPSRQDPCEALHERGPEAEPSPTAASTNDGRSLGDGNRHSSAAHTPEVPAAAYVSKDEIRAALAGPPPQGWPKTVAWPGAIERGWVTPEGFVTGGGSIYCQSAASRQQQPPPTPQGPNATHPLADFAFLAAAQATAPAPVSNMYSQPCGSSGQPWTGSMGQGQQDGLATAGIDFGAFDQGMFDEMSRFASSFFDSTSSQQNVGPSGSGVNNAAARSTAVQGVGGNGFSAFTNGDRLGSQGMADERAVNRNGAQGALGLATGGSQDPGNWQLLF